MLMNFFLPNPVDPVLDPADLESVKIMPSLIIDSSENASSILSIQFQNHSNDKSKCKSDELETFCEFKVTGILSCFFKAIGTVQIRACHSPLNPVKL